MGVSAISHRHAGNPATRPEDCTLGMRARGFAPADLPFRQIKAAGVPCGTPDPLGPFAPLDMPESDSGMSREPPFPLIRKGGLFQL